MFMLSHKHNNGETIEFINRVVSFNHLVFGDTYVNFEFHSTYREYPNSVPGWQNLFCSLSSEFQWVLKVMPFLLFWELSFGSAQFTCA